MSKEFWHAYLNAMAFTATTDDGNSLFPCQGEFTDSYSGEQELTKLLDVETINRLRQDCENFYAENCHLLNGEDERAGADFHFSRNGHGVGFFDRDCYDGNEATLQQASKRYGEAKLYGEHDENGQPINGHVC